MAYEAWKRFAEEFGLDARMSYDRFARVLKIIKKRENIDERTLNLLIGDYVEWAVGRVVDDLHLNDDVEKPLADNLRKKILDIIS